MFGEIIIFVVGPLVPVDLEFFLEDTVFHPVKTHVPGLEVFLRMVDLKKLAVVFLSVLMGVGLCACPYS